MLFGIIGGSVWLVCAIGNERRKLPVCWNKEKFYGEIRTGTGL